ncbi:hypothetical protein DM860_002970 [Cuscuta australis]|uniref:RING-type domain-containing protein n=1 Tax=Cuscuta australis TaxID=267555 RepID=A0A328D116_9ASTE|nr:hypothetical protein DM860_002970 [Cuscuta australis]
MMMADESAKRWSPEKLPEPGGGETEASGIPSERDLDLEMVWSLLSDDGSDPAQRMPQDPSLNFMQLGFSHDYLKAPATSSIVESQVELEMPIYDKFPVQYSFIQNPDVLYDVSMYSQPLLEDNLFPPAELNFGIGPCNGEDMISVKDQEWKSSTCYGRLGGIINNEGLTWRTEEGNQDNYFSSRREIDLKPADQTWIDKKPFDEVGPFISNEPLNPFSSVQLPSYSSRSQLVYREDESEGTIHESADPHNYHNLIVSTTSQKPLLVNNDCALNGHVGDKCDPVPSTSIKQGSDSFKIENIHGLQKTNNLPSSSAGHQSVQSSSPQGTCAATDDGDVCILEDLSASAQPNPNVSNKRSSVNLRRPKCSDALTRAKAGRKRFRPNDEKYVFQTALLHLSQPRSEEKPPDGVLAVPLLRHQRIALSWMVKKETTNPRCSGGILADDQGLGKTISTIALILKERSPSLRVSAAITKQTEAETFDLDDDDDDATNTSKATKSIKKARLVNSCSSAGSKPSVRARGRAAAGTLIVCPTSVLRQWSEELRNKVDNKANLSVLVYHGCNRTKDPFELADYDVVLTTYSIVSMEVPKQPLDDEDDDDAQKHNTDSVNGLSSCKKRRSPQSSEKKSPKRKKGTDGELLDNLDRPLGRVAWFRVVLDEAQSIKNYKTQVARACWGLRAKRRWCLSGTPIQNAVDDLYSYFRFLRFEPYYSYKNFCSSLKVPIQKSPTRGYRKLQAVLRTVMLRRTKGTYIDGEPIINLPPKKIELKKVEFTQWEREFYCRLEAESRAQFAKYAAAGTVKQNYINILLMLLRLRQACDHPHLVERSNSSSVLRTSIEMAKKLSTEKRSSLLKCLEASLAICSICSDPPEDAIVTVCGHVFCKQCICEHLAGDTTHCPTTDCKTELSASLLFSKTMLTDPAPDEQSQLNDTDHTNSESVDKPQLHTFGCSYDSSKIKAALEVLQSLSKSRDDNPPKCEDERSSCNQTTKIAGEKALVFSQWTGMLDLLEDCLRRSTIQYRRLDGTMSVVARDKAVKDFNTIPEVSVMIMSLKAASLGLNLVVACHVILLDPWWNPATEDQAIDRAHRIGQRRPVTVLRLTVEDTVEDRILAIQKKKRELVASAFGEDNDGSQQTRLTEEDLKYLFRYKA